MADRDSAVPPMPPLGQSTPLVPPLYLSSVYTLPDLDALDQILNAEQPGFIYARDAHPNARYLADQLCTLESAKWAVICGSGMAAITAGLLATVKQEDRVLASNSLYGRTTQLLHQELPRYGVRTTTIDSRDLRQVNDAFEQCRSTGEQSPKVLFVETLSNPLLALADVPALAELAHRWGCLLVVDNTFATPVLAQPLRPRSRFRGRELDQDDRRPQRRDPGPHLRNRGSPATGQPAREHLGPGFESVRLLAGQPRLGHACPCACGRRRQPPPR